LNDISSPQINGRKSRASFDMAIKIAWLYYVEKLTQEAIAKQLGISRIKVTRSLAESVANQTVITTINATSSHQIELERALEKRFGLEGAIVVPTPSKAKNLGRSVSHAIATHINEHMQDGMILSIGSGATLHSSLEFVRHRKLKNASVVGLVGSLPSSRWINPSYTASAMAERLGVDSFQITAPVIVDEASLREKLWKQVGMQELRERAINADMTVLTVGGITESETVFRYNIIDKKYAQDLRRKGAVANLLCTFINSEGEVVDHEVNHRVMAISLKDVAARPGVILATSGSRNVTAITAALKAVNPAILITDLSTAKELMEKKTKSK